MVRKQPVSQLKKFKNYNKIATIESVGTVL